MKQIAIVGGGGGLGSALVKQLLDRNWKIVVIGKTRPTDARVQNFYPIDYSTVDWLSHYRMIEKDTAAPVDAVIFVAGIAAFGKTNSIPAEGARRTFELNFWACTAAASAAANYWESKKQGGRFLAVLSIAARRAVPFEAYYSASKAATARFLECLHLEYADRKISFLSAFPGALKTPFRRQAEWHGLKPAPGDEGADVSKTARAIIDLLTGRRKSRVIGWREQCIDFADCVWPGLYDRVVLRKRVRKMLEEASSSE